MTELLTGAGLGYGVRPYLKLKSDKITTAVNPFIIILSIFFSNNLVVFISTLEDLVIKAPITKFGFLTKLDAFVEVCIAGKFWAW